MIHIVTASNRHLYRTQVAEMHQLRRVYFIEELGWKDLSVAADGGEYDQYDDERTVYVMALGANGEILCSLRARPTDDRCMLTEIFPELIGPDQECLTGSNVWELGRNFTTHAGRRMRRDGRKVYMEMLMATFEWLESVGVERLIAISELHWYPMCRQWGWNIRMTGLPLETVDGTIIGIEAANTAADVEAFRRINGFGPRVAHVVTDEDIAVFGTIENIEAEFELLRGDLTQPTTSAGRPVNRSV